MSLPSRLDRAAFLARFAAVWEHSSWIAEGTFDRGLGAAEDTAEGLHAAMAAVMRAAGDPAKLALIRAHPDLAGKLAAAGRLTAESTGEQASAGLDRLTDAERAEFMRLNEAYKARFGFPFILAVKGRTKDEIRAAFETRLANDPAAEFADALRQIERIALLRLKDLLT
ncbi:MAG: 2-oxo-4-hydroxy-4-carboxy-5-ureidoimidazoline decarboxylase [Phreatobacter sp.]|nr:2-oxo-4-hydroxy-4-carboxy-5-ureidoimidazoline decarboxylase [Phreatobacter sp.]